jgi:(R)-2-hydroxyacyl-CoA dehydratese activating ATPase
MTIYAGVDIGSVTTKAVLINDESRIAGFFKQPTGFDRQQSGETCLSRVLAQVGQADVKPAFIVSTGYGRRAFSQAQHTVPEIICHSRGTSYLFPDARTIIDIGGQDSKVISLDGNGATLKFEMNDKCAAGTGRFLEVLTDRILNIDIDTLGDLALQSQSPCMLSSMCTVFAESEIVSLLSEKTPIADIALGMLLAIAKRVVNMGRAGQIEYRDQIIFSGGVARNSGAVAAIRQTLKQEIHTPDEPQITAALGAALIAKEKAAT